MMVHKTTGLPFKAEALSKEVIAAWT